MATLNLDISGAQMHINKDEKESLIYLANSLINDLEMFKSENNSKQYNITRDALNKLFKFMLEPK
jgi:hypothetical protein